MFAILNSETFVPMWWRTKEVYLDLIVISIGIPVVVLKVIEYERFPTISMESGILSSTQSKNYDSEQPAIHFSSQ
jgi:hypothetical protein